MKRGAPECPKMLALAADLNIPLPYAVGLMEMLWHYTAQQAPRGDIGSLTDQEIAHHLRWPARKAGSLVDSLVRAGWLERHQEHRLIIHDWPDHADNSVKRWLSRNGKKFLTAYRKTCVSDDDNVIDNVIDKRIDSVAPTREAMAMALSPPGSSVFGSPGNGSGTVTPHWRDAAFDEFWALIWARIGKEAARKAFKQKAKTPEIASHIIAAAKAQGPSIVGHAEVHNHSVLHPATWLNQGRYDDEGVVVEPQEEDLFH